MSENYNIVSFFCSYFFAENESITKLRENRKEKEEEGKEEFDYKLQRMAFN